MLVENIDEIMAIIHKTKDENYYADEDENHEDKDDHDSGVSSGCKSDKVCHNHADNDEN